MIVSALPNDSSGRLRWWVSSPVALTPTAESVGDFDRGSFYFYSPVLAVN